MYWGSHPVSFSLLSSRKRWQRPWAATERVSWCGTWATWASSASPTGSRPTSPLSSIPFSQLRSRWVADQSYSYKYLRILVCLICTLYYSGGPGVAPLKLSLIQATLVWHLYSLSTDHLEEPLAAFGMALPSGFVSLSIFGQYVGGSLTPYGSFSPGRGKWAKCVLFFFFF